MHRQPFSQSTKEIENGSLKPQTSIQVPNFSLEGVCFPPLPTERPRENKSLGQASLEMRGLVT